jgi:hypothetical protein
VFKFKAWFKGGALKNLEDSIPGLMALFLSQDHGFGKTTIFIQYPENKYLKVNIVT